MVVESGLGIGEDWVGIKQGQRGLSRTAGVGSRDRRAACPTMNGSRPQHYILLNTRLETDTVMVIGNYTLIKKQQRPRQVVVIWCPWHIQVVKHCRAGMELVLVPLRDESSSWSWSCRGHVMSC